MRTVGDACGQTHDTTTRRWLSTDRVRGFASDFDLRFDSSAGETPMAEDSRSDNGVEGSDRLELTRLIPNLLQRYFDFFRPGHTEGLVPSRIKELARLKIAALNQCDT
jgi:hypothetical protein